MNNLVNLFTVRVESGKIGAFLAVTEMASEGEVIWIVWPTMLLGYNVFYVKGEVRVIALMHLAIFTAVSRTPANEIPALVIHYRLAEPETRERAFRRINATKSMYFSDN